MKSLPSNWAAVNSNVSEQLVIVTYQEDIPQLRIMLHCLNKYWQGNRFISIACTDHTDNEVRQIAQQQLIDSWQINFISSIQTKLSAYDLQQLYKITASLDERFNDSIVLDCKDFLLKPGNISDFKNGNRYNLLRFQDPTKSFKDMYPQVLEDLDIENADIPMTLILTPWIWNRSQLQKYWDYLTKKIPITYQEWKIFPTGSEWAGYYAYTVLDQDRLIDITPLDSPIGYWMPFGGVWKGQSISEIIEQENNFDLFPDRKFWKHHRAASTKESIEITARVLKNHSINDDLVNQWKVEISNYIL